MDKVDVPDVKGIVVCSCILIIRVRNDMYLNVLSLLYFKVSVLVRLALHVNN